MKIIEPNVELLIQDNPIKHVAKCARICYRKETGDDYVLYEHLIKSGHLSMFRHESVYSRIPVHDRNLGDSYMNYMYCPYIQIHMFDGYLYVVTNMQFIMDHKDILFIKLILQYEVDKDEFISIEEHRQITISMLRYTFKVTTQISTSRELNRVSPNAISEQSTRYVYEDGTICRPHWMTKKDMDNFNNMNTLSISKTATIYLDSCEASFKSYKELIEYENMYRQNARGVLPLDTATVCAYTYSIKEWKHILDLRYYGITGKPHPNAKIIAEMIREKLIELGHNV